jgi:hypothetical protein
VRRRAFHRRARAHILKRTQTPRRLEALQLSFCIIGVQRPSWVGQELSKVLTTALPSGARLVHFASLLTPVLSRRVFLMVHERCGSIG